MRMVNALAPSLALTALLAAGLPAAAGAEETPPTRTADLGLTLSQSSYSDSWVGDQRGSLTWAFNGRLAWQDTVGARIVWKNDLKATYGQSHIQTADDEGQLTWQAPLKTSDRIFDELLFSLATPARWQPYAAVTFDSQFHDAADHALSPAELTEAVGVVRKLLTNERTLLVTRLGPAVRHRFAYEVETITDGGFEWVTDLTHNFTPSLKVVSKLRTFQALLSTQSGEEAAPGFDPDAWKGTDAAWETTLSAAVSKYVQTTFFFELLYDKQVAKAGRFRDVLGLGLSYKLF